MQFHVLALLGLTAIASAAPAAAPEASIDMVERGYGGGHGGSHGGSSGSSGSGYCCPKGQKSDCSYCPQGQSCPQNKPDKYEVCSKDTQKGAVNLFICDVLNNDTLNIPITISVL